MYVYIFTINELLINVILTNNRHCPLWRSVSKKGSCGTWIMNLEKTISQSTFPFIPQLYHSSFTRLTVQINPLLSHTGPSVHSPTEETSCCSSSPFMDKKYTQQFVLTISRLYYLKLCSIWINSYMTANKGKKQQFHCNYTSCYGLFICNIKAHVLKTSD